MRWHQQIQYASISDIGFRRSNNQDVCVVRISTDEEAWKQRGHLFLVADGMGGHAVGELASKIAGDTIPHSFFKNKTDETPASLKCAIEEANDAIHDRGIQNREFLRMGTTCSTIVLAPEGAIIGHVGDSRVYRVRGDRIDQLTCDHSLQWELMRQGRLKPEDAMLREPRHVITRSLGPEERVQVDIEGPYAVLPGDTYVLCSDGLNGHVNDPEIGVIAKTLPPGDACRLLVHLANLRGGADNITVVIARVGDVPRGAPSTPDAPKAPPVEGGLSWAALAKVWGVGLLSVFGVSLVLFGKTPQGALFLAIAAILAAWLSVSWYRRRQRLRDAAGADGADTVLWRAYRSAAVRCDRRFLASIAAMEAGLQKSANDEGWSIDWDAHASAYASAKQSLAQRDLEAALSAYASAIDVLMEGVHAQRRQMNRELKWGKGS